MAVLSFVAVLSLVALLDVCTLTFTPPLARLIASLLEIAINRIRKTAPPAASSGVFKCEYWLNDSRVGRMLGKLKRRTDSQLWNYLMLCIN